MPAREFSRAGLDLRIIELQRNFGQAARTQAGIDVARGRLLATLDGDLQNDPARHPDHDRRYSRPTELDLLCGWRKERQDGLHAAARFPPGAANRADPQASPASGCTTMAAG